LHPVYQDGLPPLLRDRPAHAGGTAAKGIGAKKLRKGFGPTGRVRGMRLVFSFCRRQHMALWGKDDPDDPERSVYPRPSPQQQATRCNSTFIEIESGNHLDCSVTTTGTSCYDESRPTLRKE